MRKVLYAILNYRMSFDNTKEIYDSLPSDSPTDIIILRKSKLNFHDDKQFKDCIIKPVQNVAKSKNLILEYAKKNEYEYCFIIEDDVIIKKDTAFEKYLNLMDELDYKVLFYGFDKCNRVLNNVKPNPCMVVRVNDDTEVYVVRNPCSSVTLFKVDENMQMFDGNLKNMEFEYYLWDVKETGGLRSFGFFPDIPLSWTYFDSTNEEKTRKMSKEIAAVDMKKRAVNLQLDMGADDFLAFLQKSYHKELEIELKGKPVE